MVIRMRKICKVHKYNYSPFYMLRVSNLHIFNNHLKTHQVVGNGKEKKNIAVQNCLFFYSCSFSTHFCRTILQCFATQKRSPFNCKLLCGSASHCIFAPPFLYIPVPHPFMPIIFADGIFCLGHLPVHGPHAQPRVFRREGRET